MMKKLLIGVLALGSISAHADCLSEVKTKIFEIKEVNAYHSNLNKSIEKSHQTRDFNIIKDLSKANYKLWEKLDG